MSPISLWSKQNIYRVGLWCSPLLAWSVYIAYRLLSWWTQPLLNSYFKHSQHKDWLLWSLFLCWCAFWLACAAFSGLCAAFFWRELDLDAEARASVTLRSVAITWAPTVVLCCLWVVLWIPYLIYLAVFRVAVDRGIDFWNSNRPREWVGDFSRPDEP